MDINGKYVKQVLYINLGEGNKWAEDCFYKDNTIRLGYLEIDHQLCLEAKWTEVEQELRRFRKADEKQIQKYLKQIQRFYECREDTLWITCFQKKLWWCFAKNEVTQRHDDKSKERAVVGKWNCDNILGEPIDVKNFGKDKPCCRQTICSINYLKQDIILEAINAGEYQQDVNDLFGDFPHLKNEKQEVVVQRIKRFQQIVVQIKNKYRNRCQFENCGFTFKKHDGSFYSEAHHLHYLSKEGSQEEDNVVILCPNHHRMVHYCNVEVGEKLNNKRFIKINGQGYYLIY
ncbi:HNH endonuclease [Calothrix membranacea FACHB-236]|nr:HNH endonuclease [Calothrix membranacea FACHB-236]